MRRIFRQWLPLAISFELMMLEGPAVQGAIGWLPHPRLNLAAWGLTMPLAMIIESPVIMLLATAIALVRGAGSYAALRRFMLTLAIFCTLTTALVAFTPLYPFITLTVMRQPEDIARAAQPALQIMLFWTAAIAWRRFYQGILVRNGRTELVSRGTSIRLLAAVSTAVGLAHWGHLPGVQVGAYTLMVAVLTEAIVTSLFAFPVVRRHVLTEQDAEGRARTQRAIFQFHAPLAATTMLTLLAQPLTSAALGRLGSREATLAAWPVVAMALLVLRGGGLALQELTVAQAHHIQARPALTRFAWLVGGVTAGITALLAMTPLFDLYLRYIVHLPADLFAYARLGLGASLLLPLLTALGSWARGLLVAEGVPRLVYRGMGLNLATHGGVLILGVLLRLPGMWVAAGAYTLAAIVEFLYLYRRATAYASRL